MNSINLDQAAAILNSAVEFLAEKHGTTTDIVWSGLLNGHERVCDQIATLINSACAALAVPTSGPQ